LSIAITATPTSAKTAPRWLQFRKHPGFLKVRQSLEEPQEQPQGQVHGLTLSKLTSAGKIFNFQFDECGKLKSRLNANQTQDTLSYDHAGKVITFNKY